MRLSRQHRDISFEHLEDVYPGVRRLVCGVGCAEKCVVTNFRKFEAVILTRAREWGPELRAREGVGAESALLPTQLL